MINLSSYLLHFTITIVTSADKTTSLILPFLLLVEVLAGTMIKHLSYLLYVLPGSGSV